MLQLYLPWYHFSIIDIFSILITNITHIKGKVKFSPLQAFEALRVVRG
jgi:hypothetical protein